MKNYINLYLVILAMVLSLPISCFSSDILAQPLNPNKLPPCPSPDVSKKFDWERHFHWNDCWGKYTAEVGDIKGDEIESEWKSGLSSGKGIYVWANGDIYVGDFFRGQWGSALYPNKALGVFQWTNGDRYIGQFWHGSQNGEGVLIKKNGHRIEGIWSTFLKKTSVVNIPFIAENENIDLSRVTIKEERKKLDATRQSQSKLPPCPEIDYSKNEHHGVGGRTEKWHNCFGRYVAELNDTRKGDIYEGEFNDGLINGQGTYYSLADNQFKGNVYEGHFRNGYNNGQGKLTLANGDKYVGEFKDGNKHGQGTTTFNGGSKYVGQFKDDKYNGQGTFTLANGDKYIGEFKDGNKHGQGATTFASGDKYVGEFKNGKFNGQGTYYFLANNQFKGEKYVGEWKDAKREGLGTNYYPDGLVFEGIWEGDVFLRSEKAKRQTQDALNLPPVNQQSDLALKEERRRLDADRQALDVERQRLTEERNRREQAKQSSRLSLQTSTTNPDVNGNVTITIRTNTDTSSLKVNGDEQGGRPDGNYTIKRVARVGQDTQFTITAVDIIGNTDSTTITVSRQAVSPSINLTVSLKPESIKRAASRDAVAIIIGIQNYKRVPKAEFANSDAKEFYEYAIRGLGIKPENIKLLIDEEADDIEIVKAFENWLPLQVNKNKTDVYVFYSGHGLPSPDGQSLYFLPYGVDKQYLARTAVGQKEVVALLTASKPKSVTMFIDACYSGQTRGGETLIASAKPIALKADTNAFPPNFTVITASSNDQISSSSPELKHGIFSFYLMKGMEGDADVNKDGKITTGEMQEYLSDKVSRQAMSMSRKQDTQLVGDANKVLMGR